MRTCYYSPYGGEILGITEAPDPDYEAALHSHLGGQQDFKTCDLPDDHPLCAHIDDPAQPTDLAPFRVYDGQVLPTGTRVAGTGGAFVTVPASALAALQAQVAELAAAVKGAAKKKGAR